MPNNGIAQCNLCVTDFSISSGGRTGVRQHQQSARHAKLAKSMGSTKHSQSLSSSSKGGVVQFNRLSQVCWYSLGYTSANFLGRALR